jgi:RNA polymerase sigma factor (sigma-70 family)
MADEKASDLELLRDWQAGSAAAGDRLCRRYQAKLQQFFAAKVPPAEVAEMVQQTWLAMAQARDRLGAPPTGEGELGRFRAYLFGVARFTVLAYYRDRGRRGGRDFDPDMETLVSLEPSLSQQLSLQRHVQWIELALHSLPLELQLLFEGRYVEDLSGPELATIFAVPEATIRNRLRRARQLINQAIGELQSKLPRPG